MSTTRSVVDFIGMGEIPAKNRLGERPKTSTFLVQEYCNSGSLQGVIEKQMNKGTPKLKAYTTSQALQWMLDVAQGIKYLHEASPKILHRDLKLGESQRRLDLIRFHMIFHCSIVSHARQHV